MSARVEDLEPVTRKLCEELLAAWNRRDPRIRVTHTRRTNDEQLHLFRQGREMRNGVWVVVDKSRVVTNAKPGTSPHNFGLAFDVCFMGADPYLDEGKKDRGGKLHPLWFELGQIGESLGLSWGGPLGPNDDLDWDAPHFQRPRWKQYKGG